MSHANSMRSRVHPLCAALAVALAVALSACGTAGSGSGGAGAVAAAVYEDVPASGCGSLSSLPIKDPDGVVAALAPDHRAAYDGFPSPTLRSPWAHYTPRHAPPYTVGLLAVPPANDYQQRLQSGIKTLLAKSPNVGKVVTKTTDTLINVPMQLSQFDALMRENVDIIVTLVVQPDAFVAPIERAAKQGIPTVTFLTAVPTRSAINVQYNSYEAAARSIATMFRIIGGKGNVMYVRGVPGTDPDTDGHAAWADALKRCPKIKDLGDAYGTFLNATAKRETQKFLATHPQPIAGVMQSGAMAPGIMEAFHQSGRPMPVVVDIANQKGSLGYWRQNRSSYSGVGAGIGAESLARSVVSVTLRTLEGQGPKLNNLLTRLPQITPGNLDQWTQPDWDLRTSGTAEGPADGFMPDAYLNAFFTRGSTPK
jgi:ribose transport system substrate-binding protein